MDSDEEYDRRRGSRDKFRRERSDYNDRRERDDRRRGGDDWGDRRRERGDVRRDNWNRRDYNDYDRGGRRDRYSPPRGRDMSPPSKRMRRDWGDGGGYQGGYNDGYGGPGSYGGPQGGWGQHPRGRNRRGGGPDIDPTGPMMTFKAFLAAQDDSIDDQEAVRKYNEYKMEYKKALLSEFFLAHKDEEWFRFKYYPDEADKRTEEMLSAVQHRLVVFLDVYQRTLVDEAKSEADSAQQIVKLLDAAVIKMEGGTELDMTILDQPPTPKSTPNRQQNVSERERRASEMSEKNKEITEEDEKEGEDGELKDESEEEEQKEKKENAKTKEDGDKKEGEEDRGKKEEKDIDTNMDEKQEGEIDEDCEEGEEREDKKDSEKEEEKGEKKEASPPPEPAKPPHKPKVEPPKQTGPSRAEREQHSVTDVLKRLMMGGGRQQAQKEKDRSPRRDRKRKRKYSSDDSHSGSSSDSFTTSSSGSSSESSDSEDERDRSSKMNRKNSKASDVKPRDQEGDAKDEEKDDKEEREEGEKEPEEPKPRALHKTFSLFVRNVAPVITKAEIVALCKRYPGFMRVALAEPQAERNFQRHGWITFDRSVNIKEICWNLSSIRLRDCELSPVVNRELSNRVRSVSGITAHKTVVRSDLKLAARLVQQLDDKNKLWSGNDFFKKKDKDIKEKEKEKNKDNDKDKDKDEDKDEDKDKDKDKDNDNDKDKEKEKEEKEIAEQQREEAIDLLAKYKRNPVLENITEYLVEEASAEEEVLLGESADLDETNKDGMSEVTFEKDESLNTVLDRLLFYLRIVHSVDYYTGSQYHIEDEMPNRCGIMHVRGSNPPNRITERDLENWEKHFEQKLSSLLNTANDLNNDEVIKLGKKDQESEVEKFVKANTQEMAKDKWLCPLSGKKFKGPEFVRKHIFNKHGDKVEDVKKEVTFFNNYLKDPSRPHIHDPMSNKPGGNHHGGPAGGNPDQRQGGWNQSGPQGGSHGGGYNQSGRGGFNQGQNQGHSGMQNFSNRGFNQRYNHGGQSNDRNRPNRGGGNAGRGRNSRGDPRPLIQYRDLDAPEDTDFF